MFVSYGTEKLIRVSVILKIAIQKTLNVYLGMYGVYLASGLSSICAVKQFFIYLNKFLPLF